MRKKRGKETEDRYKEESSKSISNLVVVDEITAVCVKVIDYFLKYFVPVSFRFHKSLIFHSIIPYKIPDTEHVRSEHLKERRAYTD